MKERLHRCVMHLGVLRHPVLRWMDPTTGISAEFDPTLRTADGVNYPIGAIDCVRGRQASAKELSTVLTLIHLTRDGGGRSPRASLGLVQAGERCQKLPKHRRAKSPLHHLGVADLRGQAGARARSRHVGRSCRRTATSCAPVVCPGRAFRQQQPEPEPRRGVPGGQASWCGPGTLVAARLSKTGHKHQRRAGTAAGFAAG